MEQRRRCKKQFDQGQQEEEEDRREAGERDMQEGGEKRFQIIRFMYRVLHRYTGQYDGLPIYAGAHGRSQLRKLRRIIWSDYNAPKPTQL